MPSAAALVSSCRKSRSLCPKEVFLSNCASPGDSFCQVLDHWWSHGQHLLPIQSLMMTMPTKISCRSKKLIVSLVEWKLQFGLVGLRINPRRCEAWCELDEVTREKLSNTWQRSDRTSELDRRQVLRSAWGQTESKIRFGSGPGRPKLSDGSAAFFDSIFDLEPGHHPKPSNRTEIRFAKPL